MNNNQKNQSGRGGKREGSGRPLGSSNKPKISDHITATQLEALAKATLLKAMEGDTGLAKFILEQCYGRAAQAVEFTGDINLIPKVCDKQYAEIIARENKRISSN